jgi:hypothetical protein
MEDDLSGRPPPWKTASVGNDFSARQPQWHPWKATSKLDQPQQSSQLEPELGPAQPQLV